MYISKASAAGILYDPPFFYSDARESPEGSRTEPLVFANRVFRGTKIANREFEAIRTNRPKVMKVVFFSASRFARIDSCESPHSGCKSPGHLRRSPLGKVSQRHTHKSTYLQVPPCFASMPRVGQSCLAPWSTLSASRLSTPESFFLVAPCKSKLPILEPVVGTQETQWGSEIHGHRVLWKTGMLICHPATSRPQTL